MHFISNCFENNDGDTEAHTLLRLEYSSATLLDSFSTSCVNNWSAFAMRLSRFDIL